MWIWALRSYALSTVSGDRLGLVHFSAALSCLSLCASVPPFVPRWLLYYENIWFLICNADQDYVNNDLIIKWQQDKGKNESRLKRLLVSKHMTIILSDDCLMTAWWLSNHCLMTAWWPNLLMTIWWLSDDCLMTAWWQIIVPWSYLLLWNFRQDIPVCCVCTFMLRQ